MEKIITLTCIKKSRKDYAAGNQGGGGRTHPYKGKKNTI